MKDQHRISVAMATYNGEKYIEEQLLSICRQTRKPDEIVISDDGSKDRTLEVAQNVLKSSEATYIDIVVVTDNPRHGYMGNFEWAIRHSTGDLIFLSDQDDIWIPEKVEEMIKVFDEHPDAGCVFHNADLINQSGHPIEGAFDDRLQEGKLKIPTGTCVKMERADYLEPSVSWGGIHGMSMCIRRSFTMDALPFPKGGIPHDKWLTICAMINDSMYYLNRDLVHYRLHGRNTCGNAAYRGTVWDRMYKQMRSLRNYKGDVAVYFQVGDAIAKRLEARNLSEHPAYAVAIRIREMGSRVYEAETSNSVIGAWKLCKLFVTDIRYRRSGTGAYLQELMYILFHSRKVRMKNIGGVIR